MEHFGKRVKSASNKTYLTQIQIPYCLIFYGESMFKVTLIFLFLLTSLFSQETEEFPFLGITVSTHSIDMENLSSQRDTTIGIRYGKQTLDWRTMFTYEHKSNGFQGFSIEIDKILMDEIMGMPEFRPYVGVSVGALKYNNDSLLDTNGIFYGINAGLIIYTTDNIDADLSYHYYKVDSIDEIDNIQGGTLSLHYFY